MLVDTYCREFPLCRWGTQPLEGLETTYFLHNPPDRNKWLQVCSGVVRWRLITLPVQNWMEAINRQLTWPCQELFYLRLSQGQLFLHLHLAPTPTPAHALEKPIYHSLISQAFTQYCGLYYLTHSIRFSRATQINKSVVWNKQVVIKN